jgi:hypothetical protein
MTQERPYRTMLKALSGARPDTMSDYFKNPCE